MPRGGPRKGAGRPQKPGGKRAKPKSLTVAIRQAQTLTLRLMAELDDVTTHEDAIGDLVVLETAGDRDGRRRAAMMRAIELPSRAATLKILVGATRAWADLERTAKGAKAKPAGNSAAAPSAGYQSKKAERAIAAREASVGKFAPPPPPSSGKLN
jgi:hypothetical protein